MGFCSLESGNSKSGFKIAVFVYTVARFEADMEDVLLITSVNMSLENLLSLVPIKNHHLIVLIIGEKMKLKSNPVFLAITTLMLAMLACQAISGGAEATPVPTPMPTSIPTPIVEVPSLPPLVPSKGTGIACMGMRAGGVNCLTESGWQSFTAENSNLPSN